MRWDDGQIRVITGVSPSGSITIVNPQLQGDPFAFQVGKIFQGDWVMPIGEEWIQGAHAYYVKVLTRAGVGYISEFILKRSSKPLEEVLQENGRPDKPPETG